MKPATLITTIFLALISIAHLVRFALGIEVIAGGVTVPMWLSLVACLVTGALAIFLWREHRR